MFRFPPVSYTHLDVYKRQLLAALYLGRNYLVFRDTARVDAMAAHFDWLVREAVIGARDFPSLLARLRKEAEEGQE